ncbi:MAG: hypothetical protein RIT28_5013 [Pseudomonadota bacterium]
MALSRLILSFALLSSFTACFEKEVGCDDYAAASVVVTVLDEAGAPVEGAALDFDVVEADSHGPCDEVGAGEYVCGYEISGAMTISVVAEGFEPQELEVEVSLTDDECHVETISETVTLVAAAA